MENLADIFRWDVATEQPVRDKIVEAYKDFHVLFILSVDNIGLDYGSRMARNVKFIAVTDRVEEKYNYYGHNKEVLIKGNISVCSAYACIDFLYFISTNQAVVQGLGLVYSEFPDVSTPTQAILKVQSINRKEMSKRGHSIRYIRSSLEEMGLLMEQIGKRRT